MASILTMVKNKVINFLEKVVFKFTPELLINRRSMRYLVEKSAVMASIEYLEKYMLYAEPFSTRNIYFSFVMDKMEIDGLLLEFGVDKGTSINCLAEMTEKTIHGFDSFEGLPDDGLIPKQRDFDTKWYAGKINNFGNEPRVRDNVILYKGWFEDTLPLFLNDNNDDIAFMHIDCDIYSATKFILDSVYERIKVGTVIIFDDYLNFEGWRRHQHRALSEFIEERNVEVEHIAYTYSKSIAIKITKI